MMRLIVLTVMMLGTCCCEMPPTRRGAATQAVGTVAGGSAVKVPTGQLIRPAGESLEYHGRPVDLALSPDGKVLFVKDLNSLLAIDTGSWKILDQARYPDKSGASLHGLIASRISNSVYVTTTNSALHKASLDASGKLTFSRTIPLKRKGPGERNGDSYPCGIALAKDEKTAYVCLNTTNELAIVDLAEGKAVDYVGTGLAPYAVALSADGRTAFVSNWAGRRATAKDQTFKSAGSEVVIDSRGIASTGSASVIDLASKKSIKEIATGLHPSALALTADGKTLYVTNANSDTITVIDTDRAEAVGEISVCPDANLSFGSLPNAIHLDHDKLYVANGGNNAIAVFPLSAGQRTTDHLPVGFIPTAWFPGAIVSDAHNLYIANVKGLGSRDPAKAGKWNSHDYWGTIQKVPHPDEAALTRYSAQVRADAQVPQALAALERSTSGAKPVAIPKKLGEPSLIKHVLYIIKENRTYDQVLGDIPSGNGDEKLCTFGQRVTPNHHAIVKQFVLLDNYYCNGVNSADGHAWATEGLANDYLERSFGGFVRSYPYPGDDPMAFASSGFIWDSVIAHGMSFRNFGEMSSSRPEQKATWLDIYRDYRSKTHKIKLTHEVANPSLRRFSNPDSPGWLLRVTDQLRADVFLADLEKFSKQGNLPDFMTLYLPVDHTSGTSPAFPTPAAMVADNDLALGRVVEAVSRSPFWKDTAIFVIEDDPQSGFDHVDGHRSVCLVISPYVKRGKTVSHFYNQTSVLHTMQRILGLPPMNQLEAMAPIMFECFTDQADPTAYACLKNNVPLDEMNPPKTALSGKALELAEMSLRQRWDVPDAVNDDELNRILWHATKGIEVPYPAQWAGAHGRGLKNLHLKLDKNVRDDDD